MRKLILFVLFFVIAVASYGADTKISALTADATPGTDSLMVTIDDPGGTPVSRKSTIAQILANESDPNVDTADEIEAILTNDPIDFGTGTIDGADITSTGVLTGDSLVINTDELWVDGNVGIGTTAPVAVLEVNGTSKFDGVINTNNQWISGDGGAEGIYIDNLGNVGIGTTVTTGGYRITHIAPAGEQGNMQLQAGAGGDRATLKMLGNNASNEGDYMIFSMRTDQPDYTVSINDVSGGWHAMVDFNYTLDDILIQGAYNTEISGTYCDLQVNDSGKLGCVSSSEVEKTNIRDIDSCPVYDLQPKIYDRLDGSAIDEIGLIAEEVASIYPAAVIYERGETIIKEYPDGPPDKEYFATTKPAGVDYNKLIVPILIELKNLKAEVETLKARVTALEKP